MLSVTVKVYHIWLKTHQGYSMKNVQILPKAVVFWDKFCTQIMDIT
jgi:hypothetical protein